MNKVYKHKPMASDEYLGQVDIEGKVYESRFGPDHYIGRVDLYEGKIYESRFGPDSYIGRVDVRSGEVYLSKPGLDEYVGKVMKDGKLYFHKRLAPDQYLGKVTEMVSVHHGAAAFLLLILPEFKEDLKATEAETAQKASKEKSGGKKIKPD